ncbi:hypothetical protein L6164_018544 [Bauhinia variegata]|uniref:Uncharacterized protein n=1 Tax=Bauhinia variegata TaxID=167791 RepID=A0ACB9NC66_BAUVA|nr:hypothetical protein L6164_018544 [Bauhinia variegata]
MTASEIEAEQHGRRQRLTTIVATAVAVMSGMLLLGCYFIYRVRRNKTENLRNMEGGENNGESEDDLDLPLFDLPTLAIATDNFSDKNKIGEGGFGPVYKGRLVNGKEIAVKKLSKIISGKKNRGFYQADHTKNLVSHAWISWREGRALDLVDKNMEQFIASEFQVDGQNLYIRKTASEAHDEAEGHGRGKLTTIVATTIAAISGMVLLVCYFIYRVRRNRNENLRNIEGGETENSGESEDDLDVPLFDLSTLVIATDNFSENKKIGEGGFGQVYKLVMHGYYGEKAELLI